MSRDEPGKMIHTIRKSIEVLKEGNNILIFPETGIPEYSLTSVTDFYSGFASLGAFFQKKTGKPLCFCPVYIDELHHIIRSGEPDTPTGQHCLEPYACPYQHYCQLGVRQMSLF